MVSVGSKEMDWAMPCEVMQTEAVQITNKVKKLRGIFETDKSLKILNINAPDDRITDLILRNAR